MNDLIVSDEQWIEIYSDLAVILAEEYGDGPLITEIAENGDERYTDASQDRFNNYCDEATSIMERIGFKRLNDEDEVDGIIQKNPGPGSIDDLLSEIDQTEETIFNFFKKEDLRDKTKGESIDEYLGIKGWASSSRLET
tara:strand:- start:130 stop:546 length:417 start_codon:yes stop_codon:yes gene_type:complete